MGWIERFSFIAIAAGFGILAVPSTLLAKQDRTLQAVRSMQNEVHNLGTEVAILDDKIEIQDQTIAALRQQIMEEVNSQRQGVKNQARGTDGKLKSLEANDRAVRQDLDRIRTHNNELVKGLESVKKQVIRLEKSIVQQDRNQANLQKALTSLMDAMQDGASRPSAQKGTMYTVQSGDSLDKIARKFKTKVESIKQANHLKKDLIVIGQKLIIP